METTKFNKITTVVHTKFEETRTIPTIVILDEENPRISNLAYFFCKLLLNQGIPNETLRHKAESICSLYDYYELIFPKSMKPAETRLFLDNYAKARVNGTVLNWDTLSKNNISKSLYDVEEFSNWVSQHSEVVKDTPDQEFARIIKESYQFLGGNQNSFLFHARKQKHRKQMGDRSSAGIKVVKSFPVDRVIDLINEAPNVRDKIAFILMAFGGRRISEVLHMFVSDFVLYENQLRVIIADPSHSLYQWKKDGEVKRASREEYLHEEFNRVPRHKLGKCNEFVGWRGLKYEKPEVGMSEVYFVGAVEDYLLRLHLEYMNFRKQFTHHPYYFVQQNGEPYSCNGLNKKKPKFYCLFRDITGSVDKPVSKAKIYNLWGKLCAEVERRYLQRGQKIKLTDGMRKGRIKFLYDLHSLRVSSASLNLEKGVSLDVVSKYLVGHSDIKMTQYYEKVKSLRLLVKENQDKLGNNYNFGIKRLKEKS